MILASFALLTVITIHAQQLNNIPQSQDIEKLSDGWYQFTLGNSTFDVEVLGGRLNKGIITWNDGSSYSGQLNGYFISGRGTYIWPNGQRYEGSFKKHKRHGKGSMILADNSKWSGSWKENRKHGKGTIFNTLGEVIKKGKWEQDQLLTK